MTFIVDAAMACPTMVDHGPWSTTASPMDVDRHITDRDRQYGFGGGRGHGLSNQCRSLTMMKPRTRLVHGRLWPRPWTHPWSVQLMQIIDHGRPQAHPKSTAVDHGQPWLDLPYNQAHCCPGVKHMHTANNNGIDGTIGIIGIIGIPTI